MFTSIYKNYSITPRWGKKQKPRQVKYVWEICEFAEEAVEDKVEVIGDGIAKASVDDSAKVVSEDCNKFCGEKHNKVVSEVDEISGEDNHKEDAEKNNVIISEKIVEEMIKNTTVTKDDDYAEGDAKTVNDIISENVEGIFPENRDKAEDNVTIINKEDAKNSEEKVLDTDAEIAVEEDSDKDEKLVKNLTELVEEYIEKVAETTVETFVENEASIANEHLKKSVKGMVETEEEKDPNWFPLQDWDDLNYEQETVPEKESEVNEEENRMESMDEVLNGKE